jgi:hypothetical protein
LVAELLLWYGVVEDKMIIIDKHKSGG